MWPQRSKSSLGRKMDDLMRGDSFVPQQGAAPVVLVSAMQGHALCIAALIACCARPAGQPAFASRRERYNTLSHTNNATVSGCQDADRAHARYGNKLRNRVAAEARIVSAYDTEDRVKAQKHDQARRHTADCTACLTRLCRVGRASSTTKGRASSILNCIAGH